MKHLSSILDNKNLITKEFVVAGYEPKLPGAPITTPEIYFLNGNKQWVLMSATGDMTKAVYDTNNNGAVDKADSILETRVGAIQKQWIGTKAQFDAIATKDPNTCYITTDEPTTSFVALDNTLHIPITYIPSTIVEHGGRTDNPHNVTKVQLGLDKVSNTSDAEKPVSTAVQGLLNLKAPLASPTFTGTVNGITKAMVGLGNVDNESKATMFTNPSFTNASCLGTTITAAIQERIFTAAAPFASSLTVDLKGDQTAIYYSSVAATANITVNIRGDGSTSFSSWMQAKKSTTVAIVVTNGAIPYYITSLQIDGVVKTVKWTGGAPTSGNANSIDVYTYTIIRGELTDTTYTVLGSRTKYA